MNQSFHLLLAEWTKLKRSPALYLSGAVVLFLIAFLAFVHSMDVQSLSELDANPWERYLNRGIISYSVFVLSAFVVLFTGAVLHLEQRANAWKYLYTLPVGRGGFYFAKLFAILLVLFAMGLLLVGGLWLSGQWLHLFFPEFELNFYRPHWRDAFEMMAHSFLAILGVLGIQYFLGHVFRQFIAPMAIGTISILLGFIVAVGDKKMALFVPYAYSAIVQDYQMFRFTHRQEFDGWWLNNIECYSLGVFLFFVLLGHWYERRRNVH
ncbi:MAG: ABC transporter permease [Bacteroidota bacterium]